MSAVLTPMQKELAIDDDLAGWAGSAFMLGYFLSAPFLGYLGDRLRRKYLMLAGVLVWSLATAASGLAHSFAQLFAIRMVVGVGEACFVTMSPSWISDCFAATRRNTALTLFYVAIPFGSALGFTLGAAFAGHGAWREAFFLRGTARCPARVLAAGAARAAARGIRWHRGRGDRSTARGRDRGPAGQPPLRAARLGLRRADLRHRRVRLLGARPSCIACTAWGSSPPAQSSAACSPWRASSRRCSAV